MTLRVKLTHKDGSTSDGEVPGEFKPPRFVDLEGAQFELVGWDGPHRTPKYREIAAKHRVVVTQTSSETSGS
jgi:hypothetical protein